MLKVYGGFFLWFLLLLFFKSYRFKRIRFLCFCKFMHKLMDNPWLYINCFQSPKFQCIIIESSIFPWWVSRGGGGGLHVSKERGDIKKRDKKRKGGGWYTFPHYGCTSIFSFFYGQAILTVYSCSSCCGIPSAPCWAYFMRYQTTTASLKFDSTNDSLGPSI